MNRKIVIKILTDAGMTVFLLLLMAFELVGRSAHEWIGVGMFVLFVLHHVWNRNWTKNVLKGKYTIYRGLQTLLVILIFLSMAGSMISGIIISETVFDFLPIRTGRAFARSLHMVCAYWGFVLMSLHLGLHWSMMMGIAKRIFKKPSVSRTWILRGIAVLIAGYGIYAFGKRDIASYMFLRIEFVFFDYGEPILFFFLDYIAVMGLFVCIGYYVAKLCKHIK